MAFTIYHNPSCTKSKQTLQLLKDNHIAPRVIEYLKKAPNLDTLKALQIALNLPAINMLRVADMKKQGIIIDTEKDEEVLTLIAKHPELLERPIVTNGWQAQIGRPPENVLKLL